MEELEGLAENVDENRACGLRALTFLFKEAGLAKLDEPIAIFIPKEVVHLGECHAKLKAIQILTDGGGDRIQAGEDPLVLRCQFFHSGEQTVRILGQIH